MLETEKSAAGEIVDDVKEYIDTNVELYKLQAVEKSAVLVSAVTVKLIIILLAAFTLLFLSLALALGISSAMDHPFSGFLIVGGLYSIILAVVYITKDQWLKTRLIDSFIKAVFSK